MRANDNRHNSPLNYEATRPPAQREVNNGFVSICFTLCIPLGLIIPPLLLAILPAAAATGLFAIVDRRGRSILGWIGVSISGSLIAMLAIALLTGR